MFFGSMQSFYRRNSIHNTTSSQSSKQCKEQVTRKQLHKSRTDDDEDCRWRNLSSARRNTFSTAGNSGCEEAANEIQRSNVPLIKVGMYEPETSKKSFNILKEKEKALWFNNNSPESDDNSERLGPNKNNIIEEALGYERRRSGDWGH